MTRQDLLRFAVVSETRTLAAGHLGAVGCRAGPSWTRIAMDRFNFF